MTFPLPSFGDLDAFATDVTDQQDALSTADPSASGLSQADTRGSMGTVAFLDPPPYFGIHNIPMDAIATHSDAMQRGAAPADRRLGHPSPRVPGPHRFTGIGLGQPSGHAAPVGMASSPPHFPASPRSLAQPSLTRLQPGATPHGTVVSRLDLLNANKQALISYGAMREACARLPADAQEALAPFLACIREISDQACRLLGVEPWSPTAAANAEAAVQLLQDSVAALRGWLAERRDPVLIDCGRHFRQLQNVHEQLNQLPCPSEPLRQECVWQLVNVLRAPTVSDLISRLVDVARIICQRQALLARQSQRPTRAAATPGPARGGPSGSPSTQPQ